MGCENIRWNSRPSTSPRVAFHVIAHGHERAVVAFRLGEAEKLRGVLEAGLDLLEGGDRGFERAALLAEVLGALGVVPDARVF